MSLTPLLAAVQQPYVASGFGQRSYYNHTTLHPVGLAVLVVLGLALLVVRRRSAFLPLLILSSYVSTAQRLVIATLDFSLIRVLILVGFARVLAKGEYRYLKLNTVDKLIFAWAAFKLFAYVALRGNFGAFIYQAGVTFDVVGLYLLVRCWVRDWNDLDRISAAICWLSLPTFALFFFEHQTGKNLFAFLGGANPVTIVRDGRLRSMGPFVHPILAGSYWAVLLPLAAARWWRPGGRPLAVAASCAILGIVFFSASSTPILVVAAVALGAAMYSLRRTLRPIRWALFFGAVALHLAMEKPIWHLIGRISVVSGSTGYHRYRLIDAAVNHWREWAALGVTDTAHWGFYLFDLTNQFVKEAVRGGMLGLFLFICIIACSFGNAGRLWRAARGSRYATALAWALGVSLFAHICMFNAVSISHSQQSLLVWFLVLGSLSSMGSVRSPLLRREGRASKQTGHRRQQGRRRRRRGQFIPEGARVGTASC